MDKLRKASLILALSSTLVLGVVGSLGSVSSSKFEDDYSYNHNTYANYAEPVFASDDEEEEEEIGDVNKVIMHYVNDDNKCGERAFYIWVNGVDGEEYSLKEDADIVEYAADGSSMTITIDMANDARFIPLYGSKSLMYIIKYQMISPSNLNWGGQSEDVELKYSDFPPVDGVVEIWCTPAAGGGIAQFATEEETKVDGVKLATFESFNQILCTLTPTAHEVEWSLYAFDETYYKVKSKNRPAIKKNYLVKSGISSDQVFAINLKYNAHINVVYSIESKDTSSTTGLIKTVFVSFEKLYGTERFEAIYNYKGDDLGMRYTPTETTFKVWSPVAANISILIYDSDTSAAYDGNDKYKGWHMVYQPNGVWELTLKGDLKGKYYNYQVDTWIGTSVTMDPYATGAGACGVRGLIYDKKDSNPDGWNSLPVKWDGTSLDITTPQELTVYEVHIQDFTGDESWVSNKGNANGTYNAFVERGTTYTAEDLNGVTRTVSTGFDHLRELGVNAVQLMPVFDSDNDEVRNKKYNWGYNPLNYNCVEGAYSSNPHDGLVRIKEYKNLVYQLASVGTRVIMDVVYNHVSSPSASCFNKLMPRYFFRYDENGELYDGSGCHNEFKSEATMARKYIVDSVSMWAREYKIKGFRFDLMGLIDVETMRACKKALYAIDPDIILYGEGWTSGGFHGGWDAENNKQSEGTFCCNGLGNQVYSQLYSEENECILGGFNDKGRNALKGANSIYGAETQHPAWGFISQGHGDASEINRVNVQKMLWGAHGTDSTDPNDTLGANPKQTVNYASCHDNWTLRDQLYYTLGNPGQNIPGNVYNIMHASETVHALVFASNGVAFMLGGEELLRTKDVDVLSEEEFEDVMPNTYENMYGHHISHNSYNSPLKVNSFKWGNKITVTIDDNSVSTYDEQLTKKFAEMVQLHKSMPKYSYGELYESFGGFEPLNKKTSAGNDVWDLSWSGNTVEKVEGQPDTPVTSNGVAGIQFDEYFIYVTGREWGYVPCGTIPNTTKVFSTGDATSYDSTHQTINLGGYDYNTGFTIVIYNAKGAR